MSTEKILITVDEAAEILNISKQRVWSMIRIGLIKDPVVRFGPRQIRIDKNKLFRWIDEGGNVRVGPPIA